MLARGQRVHLGAINMGWDFGMDDLETRQW